MKKGFGAEGTQDHILEFLDVEIRVNGELIDQFEYENAVNLITTAKELKIIFLGHSTKVPRELKTNHDLWSLVYLDDNKREMIPDASNLLKYESSLAGENSKLLVVTPRINSGSQPLKQNLTEFSVQPKN